METLFERSLVIDEGVVETIIDKYAEDIPDDIMMYFIENDPSSAGNNGYLPWLARFWKNNPDEVPKEKLVALIKKFDSIKENLPVKDIYQIHTSQQLFKLFIDRNYDEIYDMAKEGKAEIFADTPEWFIYRPLTETASISCGNKKWCVVYRADQYFDKTYRGSKGALIYVINKLLHEKDLAIQFKNEELVNIWDYRDVDIKSNYPYEDIFPFLYGWGVPKNVVDDLNDADPQATLGEGMDKIDEDAMIEAILDDMSYDEILTNLFDEHYIDEDDYKNYIFGNTMYGLEDEIASKLLEEEEPENWADELYLANEIKGSIYDNASKFAEMLDIDIEEYYNEELDEYNEEEWQEAIEEAIDNASNYNLIQLYKEIGDIYDLLREYFIENISPEEYFDNYYSGTLGNFIYEFNEYIDMFEAAKTALEGLEEDDLNSFYNDVIV